jgi:non-specific serine/threonine protein kinase
MSQHLVTSILFDGSLALEWQEGSLADSPDRPSVAKATEGDTQRLERLLLEVSKTTRAVKPGQWLLVLGLSEGGIPLSPSLDFWRRFAERWIHQARTTPEIEERRDVLNIELPEADAVTFLQQMPAMVGIDRADIVFIQNVWRSIQTAFAADIRDFKGSVEDYFQKTAPRPRHVDRIHFHLVENRKDEQRPFAFLATYTTRVDEEGRTRHLPLKYALEEYRNKKDKLLELLATVNKVARKNALIASLVESGELFHPVAFKPGDAFAFLSGVPDFEAAGILCRIPRWWKGARKVSVALSVGNTAPSRLGHDALLDFNAGLHLDGEEISEAEARRILENAEGLALIKGRWVAVDTESLQKTLDALKQAGRLADSEQLSFADAMRMLMGSKDAGSVGLPSGNVEITCGDWLKSVLQKMTDPALIRQTAPSPHLKAELRPYQQQGLNWLNFLHTLGFGVCLADDMGLGKTVQMLAHLQRLKEKGRTSLVVVPASLLENWRREIEKFTPDLRTVIIHPQVSKDASVEDLRHEVASCDIAITTYGMLGRCAWIAKHPWFYMICDEAQAIKNPATKQAKAVKAVTCAHRGVMTGTPVENRLTDLWSLFDFINPGLLGSFGEFKTYAKGLDDHPEGYGRLRRVVHPYILRRSKTDKTIISDLPDKVEMKTFCALSKAQTIIYQDLVRRLDEDIKNIEGIQRKGVVLAYLMKCKQLCNHPDHYSGSGVFAAEDSGKFQRLAELCDTIHEKREKMLLFTQFKEIIGPLAAFLESVFGAPGLTLHGGTSVKQRKEAVDRFQSGEYVPFFILSLKAGGVGLNLTEANHVVHFDRWWNPAVENQATDRAFRIGQKKNVMVHKFVCKGTIEEKIDALIEDKKQLAGEIVPEAAENWITELNNDQVRDLFRLTLV